MDILHIANDPQFPRYINALACIIWAAMLGFALWKQHVNLGRVTFSGRSLMFSRVERPRTYWVLVAIYAVIVLWCGLAAVFGWGPSHVTPGAV